MKRRVIKQANQAYTITLPIEWVRKNNIEKNPEIEVTISDRSLIITNQGSIEHKKIKINIKEQKGRNISRIITSLYAKGIDEIEIESDKDISSEIIRSLKSTIGFALISQKENKFTIKDIGGSNYSDLDEIFKRVFQMILSFYESAIEDIFGEEKETQESLVSRDNEINKFCYLLERAINKMSYKDPIIGRAIFTYAFSLEKIGDEIQRLWRTNIKYKPKKSKELKKLIEQSYEGLGKSFEFYYQFNIKKAEEIANLRDRLREESMSLSKDKFTIRIIRHSLKIIEEATDLNQLTLMIKLE
jgi:phosphate uptake regulator